jgi:hypothetical protein
MLRRGEQAGGACESDHQHLHASQHRAIKSSPRPNPPRREQGTRRKPRPRRRPRPPRELKKLLLLAAQSRFEMVSPHIGLWDLASHHPRPRRATPPRKTASGDFLVRPHNRTEKIAINPSNRGKEIHLILRKPCRVAHIGQAEIRSGRAAGLTCMVWMEMLR